MLEKRLKELLEFVKTTDLQEVVWEKEDSRVSFRRQSPAASPPSAPAPSAAPSTESRSPEPLLIRSTMVGTFYRADSEGRPPFVVEGTIVTAGQPVASIEAMKIRKDVVAPQSCRIVKSMVEDGHAVEYGQPLFEVQEIPPGTEHV